MELLQNNTCGEMNFRFIYLCKFKVVVCSEKDSSFIQIRLKKKGERYQNLCIGLFLLNIKTNFFLNGRENLCRYELLSNLLLETKGMVCIGIKFQEKRSRCWVISPTHIIVLYLLHLQPYSQLLVHFAYCSSSYPILCVSICFLNCILNPSCIYHVIQKQQYKYWGCIGLISGKMQNFGRDRWFWALHSGIL